MKSLRQFPVSFGTSGARGLVGDFTDAYCWTFTGAFLNILGKEAQAVVFGHDLRPSSPAIAASCMAAVEAFGVRCHYAGAVPTPALALAGLQRGLPAVMVTGSHIPADRNGLKAYRPTGEITKADERAMMDAQIAELPEVLPRPTRLADPSFLRRYMDRYVSAFPPDALEGMRVAVYEQSSVARDVLHRVLQALGAETLAIGRSEAFLPVDTEAIRPEDRAIAAEWAKLERFDAIVSTDGDADRPLIGDELGRWMRGDVVGILSARALRARTVVTPVSSTTAIERSGHFARTIRTRIGSPHVIAGMEEGASRPPVVGFEANGGFLLGSDVEMGGGRLAALPTRDALLPILLTLHTAWWHGVKLSELAAGLPQRFTHSDRLKDFPTMKSNELILRVEQDVRLLRSILAPESGDVSAVDRTDGLRVTFASGDIVHLRPSGNAPELRCYAEADTPQRAEALCGSCLARAVSLQV